MPVTLSQEVTDRRLATHCQTPWVWLWHIVADVTVSATTVFQLTPYPEQLVHGGKTYYPFGMRWTDLRDDSAANLHSIQLVFDNTSRLVASYLHSGQGFIGNTVTVTVVPRDLVGSAGHELQRKFHVVEASVTDQEVTLGLEMPNFYRRTLPEQRFNPDLCRFRFGHGGCPYVLSASAAYTECPKTIGACGARGLDMISRGYPDGLLPERFGAFPGTGSR